MNCITIRETGEMERPSNVTLVSTIKQLGVIIVEIFTVEFSICN